MAYCVGVDIGGTFTDLVAYDNNNHCVVFTKAPTSLGNFVDGVLDCFAKTKLDPRGILAQPRDQRTDPVQGREICPNSGLLRQMSKVS